MIHFSSSISADSSSIVFTMQERSKAAERALGQGIRAGTIYAQTVLKRDVLSGQVLNRRSGNLSRAVFTQMDTPLSGFVGIGKEAPYAVALDRGARSHIITGNPFLAFTPASGAIRFSAFVPRGSMRKVMAANRIVRRSVNHPGNPPYHFMRLALSQATPGIRQRIADKLTAALSKGSPTGTVE